MEERTSEQIDAEIKDIQTKLEKLRKKEVKGKKLTASESRIRTLYENNLNELLKEKEGAPKPVATEATATKTVTPVTTPAASSATSSTEKRLDRVGEKAQDVADKMNDKNLADKKTEDAKVVAETAKNRAAQIDDNREENVPTWFWREAQEMSPTDKAKRGFIITNHILNRLGTAVGNVGAIVQNAGGSGGASLKDHGGSYIDQYRQSKIEQAMANRKTKQNSLLQQQIDALVAVGASENEARAIQNRLRNSSFWNKYNRLTNEQQVYIQGLLYNDTKGKINDAALGNFIDQLMEGKNVSLEQAAVNMMAAEGIDNIDEIKAGAKAIGDKVINWLNWDKPGQ